MNRYVRFYLFLLFGLLFWWLTLRAGAIAELVKHPNALPLLGIAGIYFASHLVRMMRLMLLTLDERGKSFPLIAAHALTAFPSSFLPFKIGELLRLAAFFHVFDYRRKALAVWLTERFGDIFVITAFILGLYLFKVSVPNSMRAMFIFFVLVSVFGLLGLFSVAKIFVYLNRHLVLSSHSARGLLLLRASHALRLVESDIYKLVEGRISGFLLLSVIIWALEIFALSLFMGLFSIGEPDFASMFTTGLWASLPGGVVNETGALGLYQSLALALLAVLFITPMWWITRQKNMRS